MAYLIGRTHYINFRLVDINSNPISTRVLTDLQVTFTRDDVTCTDTPLTLQNLGGAEYVVTYVPQTAGYYYLELYDPIEDIRIIDSQEIDSPSSFFSTDVVSLTQDYNAAGALKPNVPDPSNWTLFVFQSQLWQSGQNTPAYAEASTTLDANCNWVSTPLTVTHGTYHIVIISANKSTQVLAAFLKV